MKNVFKVIILLMIVFVIFAGCSTPQESSSSGSSDSQEQSVDGQMPYAIGKPNADHKVITLTGRNPNYKEEGTCGPNWFTFWCDKVNRSGSVTMDISDTNTSYSTSVTNLTGGLVCGIGWQTGTSNRKIYFEKEFTSSWGGAFGFYGWTKGNSSNEWDGLVEYYVCEQTGSYKGPHNSNEEKNGNEHIYVGSVYTDAPYLIYKHFREGFPCILGTGNFWQYISLRIWWWWNRSSGEIDLQDHVDAWASFGMDLGPVHDYQVLFTEMWSEQNTDGTPKPNKYVSGISEGYLEER